MLTRDDDAMNLDRVDAFLTFLNIEVSSAVKELEKVAEDSRKHLQKLVYANVVDRFDATVDHLLIDNVTFEPLLSETLESLQDKITEGDVLKLLSSATDVPARIRERCEGVLRGGLLRERHSRKVKKVFEVLANNQSLNKPRVNINTGAILAQFKSHNKKIPASIPGYADWLYSRRNAIVHGGGGVRMLSNDLKQLKETYHCDVAKTVKLKIGSITNAVEFFRSALQLLKGTAS